MNISYLLWKLGISSQYLGYHCIERSIYLALEDPERLTMLTTWLYPDVAKIFHKSPKCIERNIRTVVNVCWEHSDRNFLNELAGYPLTQRPTNGQFISMIVQYILLNSSNSKI